MQKLLLTIFLLFPFFLISQENTIILKSGEYFYKKSFDLDSDIEKYYRYVIFDKLPTSKQQEELNQLGINLLEYLPNNIYICSFEKSISADDLVDFEISSVLNILPSYKIDKKLRAPFPDWAYSDGKLSLKIILHKDADFQTSFNFVEKHFEDVSYNDNSSRIFVTLDSERLIELASLDFISFIEPIDPPSLPENKTGRTLHRSNAINVDYTSSTSRKYNGEGVKVMMQDDGIVGPHIDRQGRLDQSFCVGCNTSGSDHGDHVSGTIMGAGNLNPLGRGMADGSFLYVYGSSNNNYYDVPNLYNNYDVTITSKSYSNGCNAGYTSLAQDLDVQTRDYPNLIHIFSAGNDGNDDCGYGAGSGWGNVTGGHKQAKNVIAVANLTSTASLASSSSRGPAEDGRIKPDISAKGSSVFSTEENQTYGTKTGTSMSCPGVSGVMAQLYHAYKDNNSNVNPPSGLMKCIMLNTADDIGNPGPDFKHGWGVINSLRAVHAIENNSYLSSSIEQNFSNSHVINIPANTLKLKVMVYWHDKEGSTAASKSLVNDINITLTDPNGQVYNPWVLDPSPNSTTLNQNATRGIDDLNNMEQITIENPIAGTYNIDVDGFAIPFGPQEYFVSYEIIDDELKLTYPIGGESIVAGGQEIIRWDTHLTGNVTIEYSFDGGTTWGTITNSALAENGYYYWNQTAPTSDSALIRISTSNSTSQSEDHFTIVNVPTNVSVNWPCPDSINVSWNAVSGATSYEVSMLGQMYMDSMTTTSNTSVWFLNPDPSVTDSWFSVCAKVNDGKGRRAIAINQQSTRSGCLAPPTASFTSNSNVTCNGVVSFEDNSLNLPNSWLWDFGDGNTSTQQNPTHTYQNPGTYDVQLIVSNSLGTDTVLYTAFINVSFISPPATFNDTVCQLPSSFSLSTSSNDAKWYTDTLGSPAVFTGAIYNTPIVNSPVTYYVKEFGGPSIFGGAIDNSIGNGGYFNSNQYLIFDCYSPAKIVSYDVYAGSTQTITFELRGSSGNVIDDTTITVQQGLNTLFVDFDVPVGNDLQLGVNSGNSDLYRNSNGPNYPYNFGNLASITRSSASGNGGANAFAYYYFFYNIQMKENCVTNFAEVKGILSPGSLTLFSQSISICSGQTFSIGNNTYSVPGTYVDTINNFGCDSIITTTISFNDTSSSYQNVTICSGQSYLIGNSSYSAPGTYIDTILNSLGCDSIVTTSIYVIQSLLSSQNATICDGQTYNIGNSSYTSPGIYLDTIVNSLGCDSIVSTTLTVNPNYTVSNNIVICKGDSYTIGQSTYNSTGTYSDRWTNNQGCDSTIITNLTVEDIIGYISQSGGYLSANVTSGIPPYSYLWSTGDTNSTIAITNNGQFWVIITDDNGCVSQKYYLTVTSLPSSINDIDYEIKIYPNPSNGIINIDFSENNLNANYNVQILNNLGEIVHEEANNNLLKVNYLSSGIYTIRITSQNIIFHKNIIVK